MCSAVSVNKKIMYIAILAASLIFFSGCATRNSESAYCFLQSLEAGAFTITADELNKVIEIFYSTPTQHEKAVSEIKAIYDAYLHERDFDLRISILPDEGLVAYASFLPSVEGAALGLIPTREFRLVNLRLSTFTNDHGLEMTQIETESGIVIATGG